MNRSNTSKPHVVSEFQITLAINIFELAKHLLKRKYVLNRGFWLSPDKFGKNCLDKLSFHSNFDTILENL